MMNMYKILFLIMLVLGTLITISSYTWIGMWLGLEINLLSIIPLMNNSKISFSSESSLKYFITQALSSTIFLYSVIMLSSEISNFNFMNLNFLMIMNLSLFIKMGSAPFHFWFPEIMEGLNWFNSFLVLTWQKIAPMMILFTNISSMKLIMLVIMFSVMIGGMMGINQVSLRKILAYSSINHIGWMISSLMLNYYVWLIYFCIYSFITLVLILMFNNLKIYMLNQFIYQLKFSSLEKLSLSLNFMSMGGLPPFLGFFPKWLTINLLLYNKMFLLSLIMVLLTLITLFYYIRLILSSMMIDINQLNFNFKINLNEFKFFFLNFINLLGLIYLIFIFNYS